MKWFILKEMAGVLKALQSDFISMNIEISVKNIFPVNLKLYKRLNVKFALKTRNVLNIIIKMDQISL